MGSITKARCTKIMCKGAGLRDMAKASTKICKIPSWPIQPFRLRSRQLSIFRKTHDGTLAPQLCPSHARSEIYSQYMNAPNMLRIWMPDMREHISYSMPFLHSPIYCIIASPFRPIESRLNSKLSVHLFCQAQPLSSDFHSLALQRHGGIEGTIRHYRFLSNIRARRGPQRRIAKRFVHVCRCNFERRRTGKKPLKQHTAKSRHDLWRRNDVHNGLIHLYNISWRSAKFFLRLLILLFMTS